MQHARSIIKQLFITRLIGNTDADDRVYDSRIYNFSKNSLPGINVFADHEEIVTNTINFPRSQNRVLRIVVEIYAKNNDRVAVQIDNLCFSVESLILADNNLGGAVKDCRLESVDINFNNDGEKPVSVATLTFMVAYRIKEHQPTIII